MPWVFVAVFSLHAFAGPRLVSFDAEDQGLGGDAELVASQHLARVLAEPDERAAGQDMRPAVSRRHGSWQLCWLVFDAGIVTAAYLWVSGRSGALQVVRVPRAVAVASGRPEPAFFGHRARQREDQHLGGLDGALEHHAREPSSGVGPESLAGHVEGDALACRHGAAGACVGRPPQRTLLHHRQSARGAGQYHSVTVRRTIAMFVNAGSRMRLSPSVCSYNAGSRMRLNPSDDLSPQYPSVKTTLRAESGAVPATQLRSCMTNCTDGRWRLEKSSLYCVPVRVYAFCNLGSISYCFSHVYMTSRVFDGCSFILILEDSLRYIAEQSLTYQRATQQCT